MDKESLKITALKNLKTSLNKTETQINFFETNFKIIYKKKKRKKKQPQTIKGSHYPCPKKPKKSTYFTKIYKIWHTKHKAQKSTKTDQLRCK